MRAFPPVTADLKAWAQALTRTLQAGWSTLEYKNADSRASQDGILLWDASASGVVVSSGGAWVALGGGGGGATDLGYTASTRLLTSSTGADVTLPLVATDPGLMAAADKTKLDGIATGATKTLTGSATITVADNAIEDTQTVTATGVTSSNVVSVWLAPHTDDDENSPELLDIAALQATPGTDQLTITAAFLTPTSGPIKLQWSAF